LSGTACPGPLTDSLPCDQSPCQQCTMTRENYINELGYTPPSDSESSSFFFDWIRMKEKWIFFFIKDFIGYFINSTTANKTNSPVYIGDIVDRNTSISVDNCTQLICKANGIEKVKIPCQGTYKFYYKK